MPAIKLLKKEGDDITEAMEFSLKENELSNCSDLTRLPYLKDHIVLQSIIDRYQASKFYTWAGPVLIATNPNRALSTLYDDEVVQRIHKATKEGQESHEPHIYTIAGLAYNRLLYQLGCVNQAILVSGESGAGKTESARFLLKYLTKIETEVSKSTAQNGKCKVNPALICNRILASNPILEAFGNAATLRNHNSSRFGKLIKLHYAGSHLMGAKLDTFLLEKTRVTHQPANERNFHIFYQLVAGCENGILPQLNLGEVPFSIISSKRKGDKKLNDLEAFKLTMQAFDELDFSQQQRQQLFELLLAILHLGNVSFVFDEDKEVIVINPEEDCQLSMNCASSLLGVCTEDLAKAFTVRKISVFAAKTETVYMKPCERIDQCEGNRDALMQLLYTAAFSYLVALINRQMSVQDAQWLHYIAILDVYGFETYAENSLEQLCINYANERLQQEFVRRYLSSEQKVLLEEGFVDMPKVITDNSKCVATLDSAVSVFAILNEECQLKRALNESGACQRVCSALQNTGFVSPMNTPSKKYGFSVRHFAGNVNYTSEGLLLKNKDEIPKEVVSLLEKSTNKFVSEVIFGLGEKDDDKNRKNNRKITTLLKFKSSLDKLMKMITACDLHYIRCIKPNTSGCPGEPDREMLLNQLRSNGILDAVQISQAGYSMRMPYADFVQRYSIVADDHRTDKEKTFLISLQVLGDGGDGCPKETKCRFGRNRIFLSENSLRKLEDVRVEKRNVAAISIQKHFKRYRHQLLYRRIMVAVVIIQEAVRTYLTRRKYLATRAAIICLQKNLKMVYYRNRYRRTRNAAVTLQRHVRRWQLRSKSESVCPSRLSMISGGYSSMASVQYTDHSISDAEMGAMPDDTVHTLPSRRLVETEESGIETDTESLSGEKSGSTAAKLPRIRRHCQRQTAGNSRLLSRVATPSTLASSRGASGEERVERPRNDSSANAAISRQPSAVLSYFTEISNMLKTCRPTDVLQLCLPVRDQAVFYKDGIVSCHRLSEVTKMKFHTRQTCLPYSTCRPIHECPQGIVDAL